MKTTKCWDSLYWSIISYWCSSYIDRARCIIFSRARSCHTNQLPFLPFCFFYATNISKKYDIIVNSSGFFKKCSICDTVEKLPANFEAVRFFCSVNWSHKDFILIFYSYTLSTLYMQNFYKTFFFTVFIHTKCWELVYWLMRFAVHSSGSLSNICLCLIILKSRPLF